MPRNDKKQRTVMRTRAALTVTASKANAAPVFTVQPSGTVDFTQGNAGTQDVNFAATDPNNDPIVFALVGTPPAGVSYQFFTGFLRFSYTSGGTVGSSNLQISADDGNGNVTLSTQITVTLAASSVSWTMIQDFSFIPGEVKTVSVISNLVNYSVATDVITVDSGVVKPWCPFNGTGFGPSSGAQVDADDFGPIRLGVSRSGGPHTLSNPFFVNVTAAPVIEDRWERLDAASSFNAEPISTLLKGPSFGGAAIAPNGDVFFRDNGGDPNWNGWFRWSTKTLVGVDDTPITPLPGGFPTPTTTHNHSWCVDPDRNVLWSGNPGPSTNGWQGHLRYDIATNTQTNPLYTERGPGASVPGDPGYPSGPFHLALNSINGVIDYFGGYLYGWAGYNQLWNPIYRMHVATALAGNFNTRETVFFGDPGTGIGVPVLYATDEFPDNVAGFDSRTGQLYYVDQNLDLWVNNSVMDGTPRNWVKLPVYGTKPPMTTPSEHRRWACLAEWANCIVVVTWTAASFPSSFTSIIDLSTLMWRTGPSGDASPNMSTSYGDTSSRYSGLMRQDRINKRLIAIVPHGNGTAFYQLQIAGPSL